MEAIIGENRFGMGYDCLMVESIAKLNKSKSTKISIYAYYEEKEMVEALKQMSLGEAGDIIICKAQRYYWMLEDARIDRISREYKERYIEARIELTYASAAGTTSLQLIKRNSALKKLLS
jgi:hypothetical protein